MCCMGMRLYQLWLKVLELTLDGLASNSPVDRRVLRRAGSADCGKRPAVTGQAHQVTSAVTVKMTAWTGNSIQ